MSRNRLFRRGLAAAVFCAWAATAAAVPIRDVRVAPIGPVPINAEQVLAQVSARVGRELDRPALSEDIRALQKSGMYAYAEARLEAAADGGAILVFHVAGKPRIRRLAVSGADHIGNKKVRTLMEIGSGDRVDDAVLGLKAQKVRDHYRKEYYPDAQVAWTLRPVEGQPEFTDVDLAVDEGRPAIVRKIRFRGNRHARARDGGLDGGAAQIVRGEVGKVALERAHGGAGRADDDDGVLGCGHGDLLNERGKKKRNQIPCVSCTCLKRRLTS